MSIASITESFRIDLFYWCQLLTFCLVSTYAKQGLHRKYCRYIITDYRAVLTLYSKVFKKATFINVSVRLLSVAGSVD